MGDVQVNEKEMDLVERQHAIPVSAVVGFASIFAVGGSEQGRLGTGPLPTGIRARSFRVAHQLHARRVQAHNAVTKRTGSLRAASPWKVYFSVTTALILP